MAFTDRATGCSLANAVQSHALSLVVGSRGVSKCNVHRGALLRELGGSRDGVSSMRIEPSACYQTARRANMSTMTTNGTGIVRVPKERFFPEEAPCLHSDAR